MLHNGNSWSIEASADGQHIPLEQTTDQHAQSCQAIIPLTSIATGQRVQVTSVSAGRRAKHRLASFGLIPGTQLEIIQSQCGPMLIAIGDTRIAVERGIAHKVLVQPLVPQHATGLSFQPCSL